MAKREQCPTCLAMVFPDMTVELSHCAGVAQGVVLTSGHASATEARARVKENFCAEHASLIFGAARSIADKFRGVS